MSSVSYKLVAPRVALVRMGEAFNSSAATTFKSIYHEQLSLGVRRFILDFSATSRVDASGLGALCAMQRQVSTQGGVIAVVASTGPVERAMCEAQQAGAFATFPSVFAATIALR